MEIHRLTVASFGFVKTLLSASCHLFFTSIVTSVFNPQAPLLQALHPEPAPARTEDETRDPVNDNEKMEEHLCSIVPQPPMALSPFD